MVFENHDTSLSLIGTTGLSATQQYSCKAVRCLGCCLVRDVQFGLANPVLSDIDYELFTSFSSRKTNKENVLSCKLDLFQIVVNIVQENNSLFLLYR